MKVLLLCRNDWANLGYIICQALRSVKVDAVSFKTSKHNFAYPNQSPMFKSKKEMKRIVSNVDIIQYIHSQLVDVSGDISKKKKVVLHGGSAYRQRSVKINKIFNPIVDMSIIQTGDMLGLGAKNEKWLLPPIDTNYIQPNYHYCGSKLSPIFGHYPSYAKEKGTELIKGVMNKLGLKKRFRYSEKKVNWKDQLTRISQCDIYIEMFSMEQNGKVYGSWGMSTLEAAALGKIVVTNFVDIDRYKIEYGDCPLFICSTIEQFEEIIYKLSKMKKSEITYRKELTRKWVENFHSYKVVGKRLRGFYNEIL